MAGFRFVRAALVGIGLVGVLAGTVALTISTRAVAQDAPQAREFRVTARKYAYSVPRIEVTQGDLVKITFDTADIPHSFTIDAYRIAKRAASGKPVVFEFQADKVGTFPFYCNLTADDGCKGMKGELVVKPRR